MVKIKLVGALKRMAGFSEKEFELEEPTKLKELIHFDISENHLVIIINERKGGTMDSIINNSDVVLVSPVFGGG